MDEHIKSAIAAIYDGDLNALQSVLDAAADLPKLLTTKVTDRISNHAIGYDMTLLQIASFRQRNGVDPSTVLLDAGAELDLHSACGLGRVDQIESRLAKDPKAFEKSIDSYFPIQFAITGAQPEAIDCLIKCGDDPNRELKKVAYFGWEDDCDIAQQTPWRPLHMASLWGFDATRVATAKCLIDNGAELDAVSPLSGYRPLQLVAMPGRIDMIQFYIEQGADVNSLTLPYEPMLLSKDNDGPIPDCHDCTALMIAAAEGFAKATECLLSLNADPSVKNSLGHTALDLAKNRFWPGQPYDDVIKLLT